jgi:ElaB/YqjD/DUF883 family membrane-anchored ribosome-binding protein
MYAFVDNKLNIVAISEHILKRFHDAVVIPESLDIDCLKAVLRDDKIVIIEDVEKVLAKIAADKKKKISHIKVQCDLDIEAAQKALYGTINQSAALATQQSWSDIEANPSKYLNMFTTKEQALAYIAPKMQAARDFAAWRFARIQKRDTDIAAIL